LKTDKSRDMAGQVGQGGPDDVIGHRLDRFGLPGVGPTPQETDDSGQSGEDPDGDDLF
jgi:hypothetical protein